MAEKNAAFSFSEVEGNVQGAVRKIVAAALDGAGYTPSAAQLAIADINAQCVQRLTTLSPNFKWVVSTSIVELSGAGVHSSTTAFWDAETDGSVTVRWDNDSISCTVVVFGLAL